MERQVELMNASGLHARPASLFVMEANKFQSEIFVEVNGKRVNAKSILGLLSLAVRQGTKITIISTGPDEAEALQALCNLIEVGIDE